MTRRDWTWIIVILALFQTAQFFSTTWIRQTGPAGTTLRPSGASYILLPDCPADMFALEVGSICKDVSTGINKQRSSAGVSDL